MQVNVFYRNDPERPLNDPLPELGGRRFVFRLYSGDVCDPVSGDWFGPNYPKHPVRFSIPFWLGPLWFSAVCFLVLWLFASGALPLLKALAYLPLLLLTPGMFIAFRWPFTSKACYFGAKRYGVDSPEYKNWIDASEVYDGSAALCFTCRPFASLL